MGIRQLPSGKWRVQVRRKGFPHLDKVFAAKVEAEAALRGRQEQELQAPGGKEVTLADLWEKYRTSHEFATKAQQTQATERCRIKPVIASLGAYSLQNLEQNPAAIYDYIDQRTRTKSEKTGRQLSPTSVRLEIAALSSVVAFAKKRRMIPGNFIRHIDRPKTKKRRRRVPTTEQGKLQVAAHSHGSLTEEPARFALLLRLLGCRPGELAQLLRADVNLAERELLFRDTKNGTDRRVHTTQQAVGLLAVQLRSADDSVPYVFATRGLKGVWKPYNFSGAVSKLRAAAIVEPDFHAHAMRREFISRAIESGLPYSTIRKQTGHKSTQAIEIYDEGLSTAPEIRAALDKHEATVRDEQLIGVFEAFGLIGDDLEQIRAIVERRKPKATGCISFEELSNEKSAKSVKKST